MSPNMYKNNNHSTPSKMNNKEPWGEFGRLNEKLEKMEYDMVVIKSILDDYTIDHPKGQLSCKNHHILKAITENKCCRQSNVSQCCDGERSLYILQDEICVQKKMRPQCSESAMYKSSKCDNKRSNHHPQIISVQANQQTAARKDFSQTVSYRKKPPIPPSPEYCEAPRDPCDLNFCESTSQYEM